MPDSKVVDVVSLDEFKKIIQDEKKVSVAHFWASWANQCAPMDEALKVLADEVDSTAANFLRVSIYTRQVKIGSALTMILVSYIDRHYIYHQVEAEEAPDISMEHEVAAVPTCIFFRGGKLLDRVEGAKAADVSKMVRNLVAQQFTLPIPQGMRKYSNYNSQFAQA